MRNPEPDEYNRILEASDDIVSWSIAPELKGAFKFGELLRSKNILPTIAHSDAIYEEVVKAFQAGFTHITHLYSGCLQSHVVMHSDMPVWLKQLI